MKTLTAIRLSRTISWPDKSDRVNTLNASYTSTDRLATRPRIRDFDMGNREEERVAWW